MLDKNEQIRSERVKSALKAAGLTQKKFAEKHGYTANYINQIIRGKKNLTEDIAKKLSDDTDVRAEYLLGEDDYKTKRDMVKHTQQWLYTFDRFIDPLLDLLSEVYLNTSLKIEIDETIRDSDDPLAHLKMKTYVFKNRDDSSFTRINGTEIERLKLEILNYAEFLLRKQLYRHQLGSAFIAASKEIRKGEQK